MYESMSATTDQWSVANSQRNCSVTGKPVLPPSHTGVEIFHLICVEPIEFQMNSVSQHRMIHCSRWTHACSGRKAEARDSIPDIQQLHPLGPCLLQNVVQLIWILNGQL